MVLHSLVFMGKTEEDEETKKQHGRGNVEKGLQTSNALESRKDGRGPQETNEKASCGTEEITWKLNQKYQEEINKLRGFLSAFDMPLRVSALFVPLPRRHSEILPPSLRTNMLDLELPLYLIYKMI